MQLWAPSLVEVGSRSWWFSFIVTVISAPIFAVLIYKPEPFFTALEGFIHTTVGVSLFRGWFLLLLYWCAYLHIRTVWRAMPGEEKKYYIVTINTGILLFVTATCLLWGMLMQVF